MIHFNKEEFIKNYKELKSSRKMALLYNCDKKTITNYAKQIGYDYSKNKERKITSFPIEEVITKYEELGSIRAVGEFYQCSSTAVGQYLKNNNYTLTNNIYKLSEVSPQQFIIDYDKLKNTKLMADKYNCSTESIIKYAKKINYDFNKHNNYKLTDKDKQYIIDNYYSQSSKELAELFQVSRGMITKIWYDAGLNGKETVRNNYKIDITNQVFGKLTAIKPLDKRSKNGSIIWQCRCECGNIVEKSTNELRSGSVISCGKHNMSKGEEKIKQILDATGIKYETQKKFNTCIDKSILSFDFFVNNTYLIEYDGVQHFKYTDHDWNTKEHLEITQKHDRIKNQWCKNNNIPLIRIPYNKLNSLTINDLLLETTTFLI